MDFLDPQIIAQATSNFVALLAGGLGILLYQWLRDRGKARKLGFDAKREDIYNIATIRKTLEATQKRCDATEQELRDERKARNALEDRVSALMIENQMLRNRITNLEKQNENRSSSTDDQTV